MQESLNPNVLPSLFHRQIANWKEISDGHFLLVAKKTVDLLQQATSAACTDKTTVQKINTLIGQANKVSEDHGLLQIRQRVDEIVSRHLQTHNPLFEEQIRKARLARFSAALERYRVKMSSLLYQDKRVTEDNLQNQFLVEPRNVESFFDELHMSNPQNFEDDIHDTLKAYYELALRDFVEFVTQQVVESYLRDPKGPVLFFNPTYIHSLGDEKIEDLGAEDPNVVAERARSVEVLERLDHAEAIALRFT